MQRISVLSFCLSTGMSGMIGETRGELAFSNAPPEMIVIPNTQFSTDVRLNASSNNLGAFSICVQYAPDVLRILSVSVPNGVSFRSNVFADVASYSSGLTRVVGFQTSDDRYAKEETLFRITWQAVGSNGTSSDITLKTETAVDFWWLPVSVTNMSSRVWVDNTDTDGDGVPNWWMTRHFGHPTGQVNDNSRVADDADGDGLQNGDEYLAGTNPLLADTDTDGVKDGDEIAAGTDPLSPSSLLRITQVGPRLATNAYDYLTLQFQSVTGKTYVLLCAPNVTGTWLTVSETFAAVSNQTRLLVRILESMPQCFYRIRLSQTLQVLSYTLGYNLPDQWLQNFNWTALPPDRQNLRNTTDDPDGDGMDNQSEMAAGTDPTDPVSVLKMLTFGIQRTGASATGTFSSVSGRIYYVEGKQPGDTKWTPVTSLIDGDAPSRTWQATTPTTQRAGFYRTVVVVPSEMTLVNP